MSMTFAIDKESLTALDKKGNLHNFCMGEVRVDNSKDGRLYCLEILPKLKEW